MKNQISLGELLAEFIGSMFLVMAAVSPMILFVEVLETHIGVALIANALAVAFVLYALIEIFGNVSGAYFNPVVAIVMAFERKCGGMCCISRRCIALKTLLFIPIQIIGGVAGIVLTHLMFYGEVGGLLFVSDIVRNDYIYFGEIIGTFILVFAILALVKTKSSRIPLIIGLLVGGQIMATSSTMFANPQVTIARMFTNSIAGIRPFDGLIFIAMQLIGALLAYAVYKLIFSKKGEI